MTSAIDVRLLDSSTLKRLESGGWSPERRVDVSQWVRELTHAGFPVGSRGQAVLASLGGLRFGLPIYEQLEAKSKGVETGWLKHLLPYRSTASPTSSIQSQHYLSFAVSDIMRACANNPSVLVHCVCYSLGHLASVVAATRDDRVILVDERSTIAYVWDILTETVGGEYALEVTLNVFLSDRGAPGISVECAPDDFEWGADTLAQFGLRPRR